MNRYKIRFNVRCPNQEHGFIGYTLTIESDSMIMVEDIKKHTTFDEPGFHEDIADYLYKALGGNQTITAVHHGVELTTIRENTHDKLREAIKRAFGRFGLGDWDKLTKMVEGEMS